MFLDDLLSESGVFGLEFGEASVFLFGLESAVPFLEELALPDVKEVGADVMLSADVGDGVLLDEVFSEDGNLFLRREVTTLLGHG